MALRKPAAELAETPGGDVRFMLTISQALAARVDASGDSATARAAKVRALLEAGLDALEKKKKKGS